MSRLFKFVYISKLSLHFCLFEYYSKLQNNSNTRWVIPYDAIREIIYVLLNELTFEMFDERTNGCLNPVLHNKHLMNEVY